MNGSKAGQVGSACHFANHIAQVAVLILVGGPSVFAPVVIVASNENREIIRREKRFCG